MGDQKPRPAKRGGRAEPLSLRKDSRREGQTSAPSVGSVGPLSPALSPALFQEIGCREAIPEGRERESSLRAGRGAGAFTL